MSVDTRADDTRQPLSHPALAAIPAFSDNYIWAVTGTDGRHAMVVDPGDPDVVRDWLTAHALQLSCILVTHHHADHTGGIASLRGPGVTVYGPRNEAIAGIDVAVDEGDVITPEHLGITLTVLAVPGHTRGHIAFTGNLPAPPQPVLFCGDTLFSAGCGRLFEGTAAQMHASLARLAALPPDTLVCCAHEYTLGNLRFAAAVEPGNADIAALTGWARVQRDTGAATLPSSIARELRVNPFLRTGTDAVRDAALAQGAASASPAEVFATLRRWKDGFR